MRPAAGRKGHMKQKPTPSGLHGDTCMVAESQLLMMQLWLTLLDSRRKEWGTIKMGKDTRTLSLAHEGRLQDVQEGSCWCVTHNRGIWLVIYDSDWAWVESSRDRPPSLPASCQGSFSSVLHEVIYRAVARASWLHLHHCSLCCQ